MKAISFFLLLFSTVIFASPIDEKNNPPALIPLSGTYSIPGDFASINDAALSLNTNGISGPVLFNVAANHTETAPSGTSTTITGGIIFRIVAGTSATNTITFQKNGTGANPLITAGANHFAGGIMDGVIKIIGTDYLIFDSIDVIENSLNTVFNPISSNNMTEFGFAFFYGNPTATADGAKNNIIRNCNITLNNNGTNYQNTFGIYATCLTSDTNGLNLASITSMAGSNSNNKLYGNIISNANFGITIVGSNTAAAMDTDWDIGGTSTLSGNTILNFGIGNGALTSLYQKIGTSVHGILINQVAANTVSYNSITSTAGTLTGSVTMCGILLGSTAASVQPDTNVSSCNYNTINLNNTAGFDTFGIWSRLASATSDKFLNNNIITIQNTTTTPIASRFMRGIWQDGNLRLLTISENTVTLSYVNANNDHSVNFIQADINTSSSRIINGNILRTPSGGSLRTSGAINGISHSGISSGLLNINQNTIEIDKGNVSSVANFLGISSISTSNASIYEINFNNISLTASSGVNANTTIRGISNIDGSVTLNKTISSNIVIINSNNTGGTTGGIYLERTGIATIINNAVTVSNFSSVLYGIFLNTSCTTNNLSNNNITISPTNLAVSVSISGITNSVGTANFINNQITLAPQISTTATITVTITGISNSTANGNINNNASIFIAPQTTSNSGVVNFTSVGISNSGASSQIINNSNIQLTPSTQSGVATSNGILNSAANSTISTNTIVVNATASLSTTISGITNSGATSTISNNNSQAQLIVSQQNGTTNGIVSSNSGNQVSNNIVNAICTAVGTSSSNGIRNSGTNAIITNNPAISVNAISSGTSSSSVGISSTVNSTISNNSMTVNSQASNLSSVSGIISNGTITSNTILISCMAQQGIDPSAGIQTTATSTISNNFITTNLITAAGNAIGGGITNNGIASIISNNTLDVSIISNGNQATLVWFSYIYGIRNGSADCLIMNNTISRVYASMGRGTTLFEASGILLETSVNTMVSGNIISNISSNGTANNRTYLSGIYALTGSLNNTIKNNRIFNVSLNNNVTGTNPGPGFSTGLPVPANCQGIWIRLSFNATLNNYKIFNNHISKLYNPSSSNLGGIFGLTLSSRRVNYLVYNNTIVLGDNTNQVTSNITGDFGAAAVGFINRIQDGLTDLRNNILYVNVLPKGNGYVSALAAIKGHDLDLTSLLTNPGQTGIRPPNYNTASNNNLFYAPSVHNRRSYFYCEGDGFGSEFNRFNINHNTTAIDDPNINVVAYSGCVSKYKTLMNGGTNNFGTDSNSFYDNVTLTEGTGVDEGYWTPSGETYAEMGAQILPVEYDLDSKNVSRGSNPDMGAVQFSGEIDTNPVITYGPIVLTGTCGAVPSTINLNNVRIVDTAGVPTSGTLMPRLYYKINSGAYTSVTGTLTSGNGNDGFWNFTMTGITAGTLSYFVIAQDRLTKIISNPDLGLVACSVNNVSTPPTSPSSIVIGGSAAVYSLGSWSEPPSISKAVIFEDNYSSVSNIEACSVLVRSGNTVVFNNAHTLLVQNEVVVEPGANLNFENNSSLVQIENAINLGDINYKRIANVKKFDYVYWSSPVANFNLDNLNILEPTGPKYKWEPIATNPNGGIGNWADAQSNIMETARGYIVRSPMNYSTNTTAPFTSTFTGIPNNGFISQTLSRGPITVSTLGSYTSLNGVAFTPFDDNWNLIGNPYPSAISANQLLFENRESNGGMMAGFINIWRHGIDIQTGINNPFYGSYIYNYDPNDYLTYNILGASCCPAVGDYKIGAGQGFFVQMIEGGPATGVVNFTNTMRRDQSGLVYDNSTFFRNISTESSLPIFERHRIWLDLVAQNNKSQRILLGYISGASNDFDSFYDVPAPNKNDLDIYSLIGNQHLKIESRALPFSNIDEIPLGYFAPLDGNYNIAIGSIDGLFENENIYIKDLQLNSYHDLKAAPYQFQSTSGSHNNRFVLVFQNPSLGSTEFETNFTIDVYNDNKSIRIKSNLSALSEVKIYDISGRQLYVKSNINNKEITINNVTQCEQMLLLEIKTENGIKTIKKIIN